MAAEKQRHWFLTFWLVMMIVGIAWGTYSSVTGGSGIREAYPKAPGWAFMASGLLGLLGLVCAVGLFMWQSWGFWGYCVLSVLGYGLNVLIGMGAGLSLISFAGPVLLFVVLQIGGDNKGWPQLE